MHDDKTSIIAAVARIRTVGASAVALLAAMGQRLRDALDTDDTDALNALADELNGSSEELAAAITANTSAQNEPELPEGAPSVVGGEGEDTLSGGAGEPTGDVDDFNDAADAEGDDTGDDAEGDANEGDTE